VTITVSKIDETTIQVSKEIPVSVDVSKYDLNFLLAQKKAIEADLAKYTKDRNAELDEVTLLITECEKLGIKQKVEDVEKV
jgi:hypothetical protein